MLALVLWHLTLFWDWPHPGGVDPGVMTGTVVPGAGSSAWLDVTMLALVLWLCPEDSWDRVTSNKQPAWTGSVTH